MTTTTRKQKITVMQQAIDGLRVPERQPLL